jgi:hypothetical protein
MDIRKLSLHSRGKENNRDIRQNENPTGKGIYKIQIIVLIRSWIADQSKDV